MHKFLTDSEAPVEAVVIKGILFKSTHIAEYRHNKMVITICGKEAPFSRVFTAKIANIDCSICRGE